MTRNRLVLSLVGIGACAIVVLGFLIATGKIVTRNYPAATTPVSTAPAVK